MSDARNTKSSEEAEGKMTPILHCWVCGASQFCRVQEDRFDLSAFRDQDPELADYTGLKIWLARCNGCGFIQPESLPGLPNYFDRIYDQRWSLEWADQEFHSDYKDRIFNTVLDWLEARLAGSQRQLLDVGAHVGRLVHIARKRGWDAEGIELNPVTSTYARDRAGLPVRRLDARKVQAEGRTFDALTLIDVLEHIPEPVAVLRALRPLVKDGGWIAVKVPCGPNQILKQRIRAYLRTTDDINVATNLVHVNHFSPSSLRRALINAGFSHIAINVGTPDGHRLSYRMTYELARFLPFGVHTPLAMNLQAYAKNERSGGSADG